MFPMGLFYCYECRHVVYTRKVPDVVLTLISVIETTGAQQCGKRLNELIILITEPLVRLYRVAMTSKCNISPRDTERKLYRQQHHKQHGEGGLGWADTAWFLC